MASHPGFKALGSFLGGGNAPNAAIAEAQGEQLGASTQDSIAQAILRQQEAEGRAASGPAFTALLKAREANVRAPAPPPGIALPPGQDPGPVPQTSTAEQLGDVLGAAARGHINPDEQFKGLGEDLKNRAGEQILSPSTSPEQTERALLVRDATAPGLQYNLGEGQVGNKLYPSASIATPVSESVAAKNQAEASQGPAKVRHIGAQADLAAAQAANPGGVKPPAGFVWDFDENGQPVMDENGHPQMRYVSSGPQDPNAPAKMGSREAGMFARVLNSASLGTAALRNIARGPTGQSAGFAGVGSAPGHSVFASTVDSLRNALAPQEVQQYNVMNTGLSRNLASVEGGGLLSPGTFSDQIGQGTTLRAGDTEETKLMRLAETRQILRVGLETALANPRVPKSQKDVMQQHLAELEAAIPFTVEDVQNLKAQPAGSTVTLQDLVAARGLRKPGGAAPPAATVTPVAPGSRNPAPASTAPNGKDYSGLWNGGQ